MPIGEGEAYNKTIHNIARLGNGIARIKGFVIFVPSTEIVDEVRIKIERVLSKFAFANVVE